MTDYHEVFVIQGIHETNPCVPNNTKIWVVGIKKGASTVYAAEITFPGDSNGEYSILALSRETREFSYTDTPIAFNLSFRVLAGSSTEVGVFTVNISQSGSTITPAITLQQNFTSLLSAGVEFDPIYTELAANDSVISFVANRTTLVTKYSRSFGSTEPLNTINVYAYTTPILGEIVPGKTVHTFSTQTDG